MSKNVKVNLVLALVALMLAGLCVASVMS